MRILITGAAGLLGTWLRRTAPVHVELVLLTHRQRIPVGLPEVRADLRDTDEARTALTAAKPGMVIHAAYAHDYASIVRATANLAEGAQAVGAEFVHLSTEAVFNGDGRPRQESSEPDPVWDYGRWKRASERIVAASFGDASVVRLPLMVSLDPPDAATRRIAGSAGRGEQTTWYVDELRQPAWGREIAEALWMIVQLPSDQRRGVWHLPGFESLTRYDLAVRIARLLEIDGALIRPASRPDARVSPRDLRLAGSRAREAIAWCPTPIGPQ